MLWGLVEYNKAGPLAEPKLIDIPSGSSNIKIAQILTDQGVFNDEKDALLFKIAGRLTGASSKLKAGEYEVPAGISIAKTLELLEEGKTFARRVTFREGLTSFEMVRLLNGVEELSGEDVEGTATHPYTKALLRAIPIDDPSERRPLEALEGDVPSPINPPPGCPFAGRCPQVQDRCRREMPKLEMKVNGQRVACWEVE